MRVYSTRNKVIDIYRGYYTVARRYEFYVLVANTKILGAKYIETLNPIRQNSVS